VEREVLRRLLTWETKDAGEDRYGGRWQPSAKTAARTVDGEGNPSVDTPPERLGRAAEATA